MIDNLLGDGTDNRFAGAVDASRIGLAGFSLGALTTSLATFHPTLRDHRVRAAVAIGGPGCFFGEGLYDTVEVPLLMIHGDLDGIVGYSENAIYSYTRSQPTAGTCPS